MTTTLLVLSLVVKSAAFTAGSAIPKTHTCEGANESPPIEISEMPAGTQSWALIVDDPDATDGTFVHWVIWNLPPRLRSIAKAAPKETIDLPDGSRQGKNDFGDTGWGGPCPPAGKPHHYRFRAFTLDGKLNLPQRSSAGDLERAIRGHVTGQGVLIGVFQK